MGTLHRKSSALTIVTDLWAEALVDPAVYLWGKGINDEYRFNGFAFTQDEHDTENPIKRFPDRPHARLLLELYLDSQKLLVMKSRQLMVSWFMASVILWDSMHPGRRWAVTCKKFDDANALLKRMWVQYKQLPEFVRPKARLTEGYLTITHANGVESQVQAMAENSDALRSYTFSGVWVDEASFTENVADVVTAAGPTAMAGGRMVLTTTPNGRDYIYQTILTDEGRLEF